MNKLGLVAVCHHGESFYHRRKKLRLSMQDVTDMTGVSKSTISRLERGEDVNYSNVKSINDFYLNNE